MHAMPAAAYVESLHAWARAQGVEAELGGRHTGPFAVQHQPEAPARDLPSATLAGASGWCESHRADLRSQGSLGRGPIGVLGAGMMGTAIAAACLHAGLDVVLVDAQAEARQAAATRIAVERAALAGTLAQAIDVPAELRIAESSSALAGCPLVIESIPEALAAKHAAYADLEPRLPADCVIGSNTSTIPIGRLAAGLRRPERLCGLHFFHPVRRRPLVEVIRGPQSAPAALSMALALAQRIGKTPIVVDDGPGFLVNRLLSPYLAEAFELLLDGVTIDAVEQAALGFGMEMGPLRLVDEIGLDTAFHGGRVLYEAFPQRVVISPLWVAMLKAQRLGRKRGRGFFVYPADLAPDDPGLPDPDVLPLVDQWRRPAPSIGAQEIQDRLFGPMVLEASRILEEGCVRDARAVDLGVLLGLGFPAARGGLCYWANQQSIGAVVEALARLERLGQRMRPTEMLLEMAKRGDGFRLDSP